MNGLNQYSISLGLSFVFACSLLFPSLGYSDELILESLSVRARISEQTVLGDDAKEDFREYDLSANYRLPWREYSESGWGWGTRLMASGGLLRGAGENALIVSLIPEFTLGSEDQRYILDVGVGGALFSRYEFGTQDYGGPFQFALTFGAAVPLYKKIGIGYRFLHYSDAGLNGSDTTGADFHMVEISYRL